MEKPSRKDRPTRSQESRRRFPRYKTNLKLSVTVLTLDGHQTHEGRCVEIAEGGLGAMIATEFTIGELVSLEIWLSGDFQSLKLRAVVRARKGLLYGFEFFDLSSSERDLISAFCRMQQEP